MDKQEAQRLTRNGAIAAVIAALLTALVTLVAMQSRNEALAYWDTSLIFIDVALMLVLAFAIYRNSRTAAVLAFVYIIFAKVVIILETGAVRGLAITLVYLYFFAKAAQGAFAYHRLERQENPLYRGPGKWSYIIGIPSTLLLLVVMAYGLMSSTGIVPSIRVLAGHEVRDADRTLLVEQAVIRPEDRIDYLYAYGPTSVLEGCNILVQDRLIIYFLNEKQEMEMFQLYFDEIDSIINEEPGDSLHDAIYKVSSESGAWLRMNLSTDQHGDQKFIEALRSRLRPEGASSESEAWPRMNLSTDQHGDQKSIEVLRSRIRPEEERGTLPGR